MSAFPDLRGEAARLKAAIWLPGIIGGDWPLRRAGRCWAACCPFHAERTPSFYVYPDHFHCFGCGAHGDVFDWLMRTRRLAFRDALAFLGAGAVVSRLVPMPPRDPDTGSDDEPARKQEIARRIWAEAVDPRGSPVERYLQSRGVCLPGEPVIRFHPRCPRAGGPLPAMVALMSDPVTGKPCGIHRTFLKADGSSKAPVAQPKMMLGSAGVIRLDDQPCEGLGLAEGIETALSVGQRIGWGPVWAAGTRGGIDRFPLLPGRCLNLFADGDMPGLSAARACAQRWAEAGLEVWIHVAPAGQDWNDAAQRIAA